MYIHLYCIICIIGLITGLRNDFMPLKRHEIVAMQFVVPGGPLQSSLEATQKKTSACANNDARLGRIHRFKY